MASRSARAATAASAASRVSGLAAGSAGYGWCARYRRRRAGVGWSCPARSAVLRRRLPSRCCGMPNDSCQPIRMTADSTMNRRVFFWSFISEPRSRRRRLVEIFGSSARRAATVPIAPDQHIIMTGPQSSRGRKPHDFAQPPPHPIALDRVADLLRHGEADPHGAGLRRARAPAARRPPWSPWRLGGGQEIGALPQSLHGRCAGVQVRRSAACGPGAPLAITLRPPLVAIRARNPCRRLRTSLLG